MATAGGEVDKVCLAKLLLGKCPPNLNPKNKLKHEASQDFNIFLYRGVKAEILTKLSLNTKPGSSTTW